jgi:hypothetical protein
MTVSTLAYEALADEIGQALRAVANPVRAVSEQRYLKSDLEFIGVSVTEARRVVREFLRDHGTFDRGSATHTWASSFSPLPRFGFPDR